MTADIQNLALVAEALRYAFYTAAAVFDRNFHEHYHTQIGAEDLAEEFAALEKQALHDPMPEDIQARWDEEDRQITEQLKTDPTFAAAFIALSDRYVALFNDVTPERGDTVSEMKRVFAKKCKKTGADLTQPVAEGLASLNAEHLSAACRKLTLQAV